MRDKIFYISCFGFILGVLLSSLVLVNVYTVLFLIFLASVLIIIQRSHLTILLAVFLVTISLGIFRFNLVNTEPPEVFESQVGQKMDLQGFIVDEIDVREKSQKLTVEVGSDGEKTKILVTTNFDTDFKYGDEVKIYGKLKKPENFTTDQGKEFDYINYLRKDGIRYVMAFSQIEVTSRGNGNKIKNGLFYIKEKFLEKMNFAISPPESLLMGGLILGEKSAFDETLRQSFVDTGTIHIVALSGYNVTIVAEWFMKIFKFLPQMFAIWAGIFAILLFVLMTGASSTAIRAGIMAMLALLARATGRDYDVARALVLAGVLMIMVNPFILVYDVSFQLSFIATVAVIFYAPRIEKYFTWVTTSFGLRDIASVTFAAYIFVMPFILFKMGNFSLVALPANILILPFIPLTMLLGFLTGFAGIIWQGFSLPLGFLSYLFLHYELAVVGFLARLPFAAFTVTNFPLWLTIGIYVYFLYILFGRSLRKILS